MNEHICNICGKNPANIHFTELRGNKKRDIHICTECAAAKGINIVKGAPIGINIENLFSDFFSSVNSSEKADSDLKCKNCGILYRGFLNDGKLGCSECYTNFEKQIKPTLKRIHGSINHIGKIPQGYSNKQSNIKKIRNLQMKLNKAISEEKYEIAAKLRDEIKKIKETKEDGGKAVSS